MRLLLLLLSSSFLGMFAHMIDPLAFNPPFYLRNKTEKPMYYAVGYEQDQKQLPLKRILPGQWVVRTDVSPRKDIYISLAYGQLPEKGESIEQYVVQGGSCKKINLEVAPGQPVRGINSGQRTLREYVLFPCVQVRAQDEMALTRSGHLDELPGNVSIEDLSVRTVAYNPAPSKYMPNKRVKELTRKDIEALEREITVLKYLREQAQRDEDMTELQRAEKELLYVRSLLKARYPDWFTQEDNA